MLAEVNGIRLAYSDSGHGSPVVLLVHAFPVNRSMWDPQAGRLRAFGARVVAPDLRGFGASEAGPLEAVSMDQHADDLAGLLDHLEIDEPVVFCGLSMGGYVGFAFWRHYRERMRALVLADTRAGADSPEQKESRLRMAQQVEEAKSSEPVADQMLPRMFSPAVKPGSVLWAQVRGMMLGASPEGVAASLRGMAERPDSTPLLPEIQVPSLVLVGEMDQFVPVDEAQRMAEGLPRSVLEVVPGAGHLSNLENPDAFGQTLEAFSFALLRQTS